MKGRGIQTSLREHPAWSRKRTMSTTELWTQLCLPWARICWISKRICVCGCRCYQRKDL